MRKLILLLIIISVASCKKDNTPPDLKLKTGPGYTYANVTLTQGTTFVVGMDAYSGASDLNEMYTEVAYDGASDPHLVTRVWLSADQKNHYQRDLTVTTRTTTGTERWVFNINDDDGRISKVEIMVRVQ
jgi:hypothetical protein